MQHVKRIAVLTSLTAAAIGGTAPATAATSRWSGSRCNSYAKKHAHSKKSKKAAANKTLKAHGCTVHVK
jgi:hypothetical protein